MELHDFCLADDFIRLKGMINDEVDRRKYTDLDKLYNIYNSTTEEGKYSIVPEKYGLILQEHIDKITNPIKAIHSQPDLPTNDYIYALKVLETIITAYQSDERHTSQSAIHCQSNCIGMCVSCTSCSGCEGCQGCTSCTSCSGSCSGCTGCSGTCSGGCQGRCGGGCGVLCQGECTAPCTGVARGWN